MSTPADPYTLAGWRRAVAEHYARVRSRAGDPAGAAEEFRAARGRLFAEHPDSPIPPARRAAWRGPSWYPYDRAWRIVATIDRGAPRERFEVALAADGLLRCTRVGYARFAVGPTEAKLAVYWLEGYGGGLWLPFADATSGAATYGGGRYLYDTIKGADLGASATRIPLDFNYAYNPSCAYDAQWSCPLSPPENRLPFAVTAGERAPP